MNTSSPQSLARISLSNLNFTANCGNVVQGYQVWYNDFYLSQPTAGNLSTPDNSSNSGPGAYTKVWSNGTSPEFISFWRTMLPPTISAASFSDADIAAWTNSTPFYDFFQNDVGDAWPRPDKLDQIANSLASSGGCKNNNSRDAGDIKEFSKFQQACMLKFCCSSGLSKDQESSQRPYPYSPSNWTVESACAFDTCQHANKGNPDLGGVGVVVAYFIQASLLLLSLIAFGIKLVTDYFFDKPDKRKPRILAQHDAATVAGAGVFLDNAVYFSFAINFASILFNYHAKPLLYEDKLGQTSSLLAIDAPVAIALMSYHVIDRKILRSILVLAMALMTFIVQFLFRRSQSFAPSTSLCLAWDDGLQQLFVQRFIAKAVWAGVVVLFFATYFIQWGWLFSHSIHPQKFTFKRTWWQRSKNSPAGFKVSKILSTAYGIIPWRRLFAYLLASYGLFAIIIDIQFILFLRIAESEIASQNNEGEWGYGQLLAVFVWIPVYVEYIYIFGFQRDFWGKHNHNAERIVAERRSFEMNERTNHPLPTKEQRLRGILTHHEAYQTSRRDKD